MLHCFFHRVFILLRIKISKFCVLLLLRLYFVTSVIVSSAGDIISKFSTMTQYVWSKVNIHRLTKIEYLENKRSVITTMVRQIE